MINLIPNTAKKSVLIEYWLRVITVWFLVWSGAMLVGVLILIPAYFLIDYQVVAFEASAKYASEKVASYENVSRDLVRSSQQAGIILEKTKVTPISKYLANLEAMQTKDIELTQMKVQRNEEGIVPISLVGKATSRQALAAFRDRLLETPYITVVDLPISNLAKDRDILFPITVTIDNSVAL